MKKILLLLCVASCAYAQNNCPTGKGWGQMIYNEACLSCSSKEKILTAPNGKGKFCCSNKANSVAWNGESYVCCSDGLEATVVPGRDDSICCPAGTKEAVWEKEKGILAYTCGK